MTKTKDDGGPAFPSQWHDKDNEGMSLRDWFAGQAMAGVIPTCNMDTREDGETREMLFARKAYRIADAMLEARK
jgi:hypothetical protein